MSTDTISTTITSEDVADYLETYSNFFIENPDLVEKIKLKHESGKAVSLVEHQVSRLRNKNEELEAKLNSLILNARDNDRLFRLTRRAINAFLEAEDLGDLVDALYYQFDKEFKIAYTSLLIFDEPQTTGKAQNASLEKAEQVLSEYFNSPRARCGTFNDEIKQFIFGDNAKDIGSLALTFLKPGGEPKALLAIGHSDEHYYQSGTETLFLNHISDVLERIIKKME